MVLFSIVHKPLSIHCGTIHNNVQRYSRVRVPDLLLLRFFRWILGIFQSLSSRSPWVASLGLLQGGYACSDPGCGFIWY
ncbi:hypothetical protein Q3G72_031726 [Acer saccharum]|nr:hypothetical protein Q3G72_031726 [Acer saccharum]